MSGALRGLALANLTIVLLILFWEEIEALRILFTLYLVINTIGLLVTAAHISQIYDNLDTLAKTLHETEKEK